MHQTTHCTRVMHTAMIQQQLMAGCCQISVEYLKMYRHFCTMYIHICKFLSMYMKWTGITYLYRHVCTITYLYVHGKNMYIPCIYRFYIPVQGQTCLYMVQTCLYRIAKSCPGGQDSRWLLLPITAISKYGFGCASGIMRIIETIIAIILT
jgi:hypothetical protein